MSTDTRSFAERMLNTYSEKPITKIDELRALDKKATKNAYLFAYIFGTVASLILGLGMCIAMKIILPELMIVGIIIGLIGIFMVIINYRLFKKILLNGRAKYAEQIKKLSKEILNEE